MWIYKAHSVSKQAKSEVKVCGRNVDLISAPDLAMVHSCRLLDHLNYIVVVE